MTTTRFDLCTAPADRCLLTSTPANRGVELARAAFAPFGAERCIRPVTTRRYVRICGTRGTREVGYAVTTYNLPNGTAYSVTYR